MQHTQNRKRDVATHTKHTHRERNSNTHKTEREIEIYTKLTHRKRDATHTHTERDATHGEIIDTTHTKQREIQHTKHTHTEI